MPGSITNGQFTNANALATLLSTESLLFAAFSVTANLLGARDRVRAWILPGRCIAWAAVVAISVVAAGAATSWVKIFASAGFPQDFPERLVAVALAAAIVVQPLLAGLLAGALQTRS